MASLIVGIALFKTPKNTKLTTYLYPYSYVSKIESKDTINIKLLIDNKKSYFLDKDKITNSYIGGLDGKIKLNVNSIDASDTKIRIKGNDYFLVNYYFDVDLNVDSEYELFINKAYLYLTLANGISTNIYIGSFSYYKYEDTIDKISITNLKAINNKQGQDGFYGIIAGIRNLSHTDIIINDIKLLDGNIKNITFKTIDSIESANYEDYFSTLDFQNSITLKKDDITYIAATFDADTNLMYPASEIGLKISTDAGNYYIEKFTFYKLNYLDTSSLNFTIYEYK